VTANLNAALALCRWLQPLLRIAPVRAAACAIFAAALPQPPPAGPAAAAAAAAPCELEQFAHPSARPALRTLCARLVPPGGAPQYGPPAGKKVKRPRLVQMPASKRDSQLGICAADQAQGLLRRYCSKAVWLWALQAAAMRACL
jgi:hypothetical protein